MIDKATMQQLKQVDVSKDAEKTKTRVRELWSNLPKNKRESVLDMSGLAKFTVERAYKFGKIQAKLVVAFFYVCKADPMYITGRSDKNRQYREHYIIEFLNTLGYRKAKLETADGVMPEERYADDAAWEESAKIKEPAVEETEATPEQEESASVLVEEKVKTTGPKSKRKYNPKTKPTLKPTLKSAGTLEPIKASKPVKSTKNTAPEISSTATADSLAKYIGAGTLKNMIDLTEDDCMLLLKGQFIQAKFDKNKEIMLSIIKYLLLS